MGNLVAAWQFWALLAAGSAALTAIFAKLGVSGVNSDFATFVRTIIIVFASSLFLFVSGNWQSPATVSGRTWLFLVLSGLATGASWLFYFRALSLGNASQVAPIDKLSVVFIAVFAAIFLGERLSAAGWLGVAMIASGALLVSRG